ncbi:peptidoglycan DD-metalloendopeptidase family protein [Algoriphagus sp.]|uniref:peptidoglycan DD-metalloendopeptidase family protein n=1 Tax=Algoriphagus sp. TaxID=1872435 RepID=UPI0025D107A3|nr:peptidoglycan DD-metalloendopeptidase family protein [Algoriphagus sp.]
MAKKLSAKIRNLGSQTENEAAKKVTKVEIKSSKPLRPTIKSRTSIKRFSLGTITSIWHDSDEKINPRNLRTIDFKFEKAPTLSARTPKVGISFEPMEGGDIVFHPTPGFTSQKPWRCQVSIRAYIHNQESKKIDLNEVIFEYKIGSNVVKKTIHLPSDKLEIEPNYIQSWQNSREYHENGDVIFIEAPFPTSIKMSFIFEGFPTPVTFTKKLKPYTNSFAFPFDIADFSKDEFVEGYSMHGGGDQVFAYDLGVAKYDSGWTSLVKDKDGSENDHHLIWGKKIRAMADGTVMHFENNVPNNWAPFPPDKSDAFYDNLGKKQMDELWGSFDYGGSGNHLYIRHGNLVALYAHMIKGSVSNEFLKVGAVVKKGQVLGKAGNSGSSSGPHFHVHIKTFNKADDPEGGKFRPLLFNTGFVIGKDEYQKPGSNINWSKLNTLGIPGQVKKPCLIYPNVKHPYCEYPTNWGEVCRFGLPLESYQTEFDKIWPCGYYPIWVDGYEVNGKTYFNVIFRQSNNISWAARHQMSGTSYQKEFDKFSQAGYRLVHVNSYLSSGKINYAAIWVFGKGPGGLAYHGKSLKWHEDNFQIHINQGLVPVNVSCVKSGSKTYVTALWEKIKTGGFYLRPVMTLQSFKEAFDQYTNKEKFKLVYLDAYLSGNQPLLSGIWYKKAANYNGWFEKHNLNSSQFQNEYNQFLDNGYLTRVIAGYEQNNQPRFEGIWSK